MATITLDLNRFKASGIYTIEFDASQQIVVSTQTVRLVVGFSRVGPFNAPVFLTDIRQSRKIFGTIDTKLEARGSYFHRAIETCLSAGPIFALNLLALNNVPVTEGGDAVDYRSFALAANEDNGNLSRALYASFYNKERFWFPDTSYLQATVDSKPANAGRLFNIVNLGQQVNSVIIRKSVNATQYNLPADEYYDTDTLPEYVYGKDYMSDYFVDVYVVKGDWSNYTVLAKDPIYSKYFDLRGIIVSQLENFLSLDGVTMLGAFTGCVIPSFIDNNGVNQSIDVIVNNNVSTTGLFLNLNEDALMNYDNSNYQVDMIGNTLISTTKDTIDFLSYNTPIKNVLDYTSYDVLSDQEVTQNFLTTGSNISTPPYVKSYPYGGTSGKFGNILVLPMPRPDDITFTVAQWTNLADTLTTNTLIKTFGSLTVFNSQTPNDYLKVENVTNTGTELLVQLSSPLHVNSNYESSMGNPEDNYIDTSVAALVPSTANTIVVNNFANLTPVSGDIILVEAPGYTNYFQVNTVSVATVTTITVATTGLSTGSPFYADQWCTTGFAADEFAAFQQPTALKVTLLSKGIASASHIWPNLKVGSVDAISYINAPAVALNNVQGLGQTALAAVENEVVMYNETTSSPILGTFYIVDSLVPGVDLNYAGGSNATYNNVRVIDSFGNNPFVSESVTDVIRVTLPSGQIFRGLVATITVGAVGPTTYTLNQTDIAQYAYVEAYPGAKISQNIKGSLFINGDRVKYGIGSSQYNYIHVDANWGTTVDMYSKVAYGLVGSRLRQYTDTQLLTPATASFAGTNNTFIDDVAQINTAPGLNDIEVYSSLAKNIEDNVAIEGTLYGGGKNFKLSAANASQIEVGDFIVNNDPNNPHLVRVTTKVKKLDPASGVAFYEYTILETPAVTTLDGINYVTRFTPIQKFGDRFQFTVLSGFKITEFHLPGSPAQLEKILSVLETTNIGTTLESKDIIQYRYIVDTFNGGLEPHMGPKQYLSRLAMNRQQCMAILNAPSVAEFLASTDPRFTDLPDAAAGNPKPVLNTDYIATGGNLTLGPSFTWSLPDEENGAKFIGVFTPNIIIREDGKNKSIPPAADVSNNFIRKFVIGEPYSIVAGPRRGVIANPKFVKMEYDYLLSDRENLEPFGLNPIVVVRNVGPMIFANQTAYQRTISAFNNLHVRDLLITIEEGVIEILQNYLFEFNDASTRLEIRTTVETYLDVVRTAGGLNAYEVIMDETNNTPDLIDQNFGILDIGIEPTRGLQKFVNRITVLKTGAIAAGGFNVA